MAILSSIHAWTILGTEEPGMLRSIGSQRVGHKWSDLACMKSREPSRQKNRHIYISFQRSCQQWNSVDTGSEFKTLRLRKWPSHCFLSLKCPLPMLHFLFHFCAWTVVISYPDDDAETQNVVLFSTLGKSYGLWFHWCPLWTHGYSN